MSILKAIPGFKMIENITGYVYGGVVRQICSSNDEKELLNYLNDGDIDVRIFNRADMISILDHAKFHNYDVRYLGLDYLACQDNELVVDNEDINPEGIYSIWVKSEDHKPENKTINHFIRYEIVYLSHGALTYTHDYTVNQGRIFLPKLVFEMDEKYIKDIKDKLIIPMWLIKCGGYDQLKCTHRMARLFTLGYRPFNRTWCQEILNRCEKEIKEQTHKIYIGSKQFPYSDFRPVEMTIDIWKQEMKDVYEWLA
jgi:hypothetical protein